MSLPAVALVVAVFPAHPVHLTGRRLMSNLPVDPAADKTALRKEAAATRAALAKQEPDAADRLAGHAGHIADLAAADLATADPAMGGVVAAYLPIRSELSPLPLVAALTARGVVTAMPVTPEPENPLSFHQWAAGDVLVDGPYRTQQPSADAPRVTPSIILAPMLAFDAACWRLGYGGGFYDRTLAGLRAAGRSVIAIGIAYDGQQVDQVPTGPYDMALDAVLTPSGMIQPQASTSGEL